MLAPDQGEDDMANPLADGNLDAIPAEVWKRMNISKQEFAQLREHMIERNQRTPAAGTPAPDFEIERLSGKGQRTGRSFRLSSRRGTPVGLIFGSYT
jgi:hypothetical protein